jgi:glycosyltransferase involved in cell wall biosynthesis
MVRPVNTDRPSRRLTIGMPLYNNARTVHRALDSLISQTFGDFRLTISDDGSTDGTAEICDQYAAADSRIRVVRQSKNLNYGNFRYALRQADTPLFMFAAGDDYWHPTYIRRMIDALDSTPGAVCAVSRATFVKGDTFVMNARGTEPLLGPPARNILEFLAAKDDNTRMYGVMRTDVARRAFPPHDFHAYDWAFSIGTLLEGVHVEVPEVLMWRDYTEFDRYVDYVRRDAHGPMSRVFPMLPLTLDLLDRLRIPMRPSIVRELWRMNMFYHRRYLRRYHPRAARFEAYLGDTLGRLAKPFERRGN